MNDLPAKDILTPGQIATFERDGYLLIEDAVPLSPNPVPNRFQGEIVVGEKTGRIRCTENEMMRPELPKKASFFFQQQRAGAKG